MTVSHLSLLQVVLEEVAAVMHRLRRLDLETDAVGEFVDLAENLLEVVPAQEIAELAATNRD